MGRKTVKRISLPPEILEDIRHVGIEKSKGAKVETDGFLWGTIEDDDFGVYAHMHLGEIPLERRFTIRDFFRGFLEGARRFRELGRSRTFGGDLPSRPNGLYLTHPQQRFLPEHWVKKQGWDVGLLYSVAWDSFDAVSAACETIDVFSGGKYLTKHHKVPGVEMIMDRPSSYRIKALPEGGEEKELEVEYRTTFGPGISEAESAEFDRFLAYISDRLGHDVLKSMKLEIKRADGRLVWKY